MREENRFYCSFESHHVNTSILVDIQIEIILFIIYRWTQISKSITNMYRPCFIEWTDSDKRMYIHNLIHL